MYGAEYGNAGSFAAEGYANSLHSLMPSPANKNDSEPQDNEAQALIDRQFMRLQLTAVSMSASLKRMRCCCILPVTPGALFVSIYVLLVGLVFVWESCAVDVAGYEPTFFHQYNRNNPFVWLARILSFIVGVGSIAVALIGAWGISHRKAYRVFAMAVWIMVSILLKIFIFLIVVRFHTYKSESNFGDVAYFIYWRLGEFILELYLAYATFVAAFSVLYKGTVAPSMADALHMARVFALGCGDSKMNITHLVASTLQDRVSRRLLEIGGVNVTQLMNRMDPGLRVPPVLRSGDDDDDEFDMERALSSIGFGPDTLKVLADAISFSYQLGDTRLTADHLILSLCHQGPAELEDAFLGCCHDVDADSVKTAIMDTRKQVADVENASPPPPTKFFGCIPLEATVVVYATIETLVSMLSLFAIIYYGEAGSRQFGLRTWRTMQDLEFFVGVVGTIMGLYVLVALLGHRSAVSNAREAACEKGARPDLPLDEIFGFLKGEEEAERHWLKLLKRGADRLGVFLMWSGIRLFVDLLLIFTALSVGNICGLYANGLTIVSQIGPEKAPVPLPYCSTFEISMLIFLAGWFVIKCLAIWVMLTLWHEYQYGWTLADFRDVLALDGLSLLPENVLRFLAGLPRYSKTKNFARDNKAREREPLIIHSNVIL